MRIQPHGEYSADLHEFKITDNQETALLTCYPRAEWDYVRWPSKNNETDIWENIVQEINLETGELLFEWKASDHFTPEDCFNPKPSAPRRVFSKPSPPRVLPVPQDGSEPPSPSVQAGTDKPKPPSTAQIRPAEPWDWFHINSIDKDDKGNYLISSRYSHSLSYIDGVTGKVLWQLGGRSNSFEDLSNGRATSLAWQHHASWQDNYTAITVFDNQAVSWSPNRAATATKPSRALKIRVDQDAMTAEVVMEALHPQGYSTQSQGSIQQLANGNFFVGYGNAAAMTEYSPSGEVVCDFQFGALHYRVSNFPSRNPLHPIHPQHH